MCIRDRSEIILMKIIDLYNTERVNKSPDDVEILMSSGSFVQDEFVISKVELRLYKERNDDKLGAFSLITSFVETDKGSVEMIFDEGFRGDDPLKRTKDFLISNLGISALVLRSIICLREKLD